MPAWPTVWGGDDRSPADARAITAALVEHKVPMGPGGAGLTLAAPTIVAHSSEETKRRFLPRIVTGEELWCQLFSEPGAGSDLAALGTRAVRDGDEWVVSGQKVWTTMGHVSQFAMLLARTNPDAPKHKGITYFACDLRSDGVEVRGLRQMTGEAEFNEVFLTDARIPDLYRISDVDEGWGATMTTLANERVALSGGGGDKAAKASSSILGGLRLEAVLALAAERGAGADPLVRARLTQALIDQRVLDWTIRRAAANRRTAGPEGSVTKLAKALHNQRLQQLATDVLGPEGQAWDGPSLYGALDRPDWDLADALDGAALVVRGMLRSRANTLEGGTAEILRNILGERVLGLPGDVRVDRDVAWKDLPR
jgi:alkylation response protein AidB-like acyl-CoA dehydrogenase